MNKGIFKMRCMAFICIIGMMLPGCTRTILEDEKDLPINAEMRGSENQLCYIVQQGKNHVILGFYDEQSKIYLVFNNDKEIVYQYTGFMDEIVEREDGSLQLLFHYGTFGPGYQYYDPIQNRISKVFEDATVIAEAFGMVAYLDWYRDESTQRPINQIVIEELYDEAAFQAKYARPIADAHQPWDGIKEAHFLDENTLSVEYYVGEHTLSRPPVNFETRKEVIRFRDSKGKNPLPNYFLNHEEGAFLLSLSITPGSGTPPMNIQISGTLDVDAYWLLADRLDIMDAETKAQLQTFSLVHHDEPYYLITKNAAERNAADTQRSDLLIEDMNFDGYLDFRILKDAGTAKHGFYAYWIWDAQTGTYMRDMELENALLSGPVFDLTEMRITSHYAGSALDYEERVHCYLDGRLTLCEKVREHYDAQMGVMHKDTWKLQGDELVLTKEEAYEKEE